MKQFEEAGTIIRKLKEAGYEAYFVGGSVRDYMLGRPIGDIDIATSALPEEVMQLFPKHIPVGLQHGTVIVLYNDMPYEVTTYRTESGYEDFRRPNEVTFVRSLQEDLQRRDFTMNAIAMTEDGTIVDPFHGKQALDNKIIKTVGEPSERFQEDALRMMRGVRFVSALGFTLEQETKQAILQHAPLLLHISIERIAVEFEKLLLGAYPERALSILVETHLHLYLPGFEKKEAELLQATSYAWKYIQNDIAAWTLLLHLAGLDAGILKNWKLSNKKLKAVTKALAFLQQRFIKNWSAEMLYEAGKETVALVETIYAVLHRHEPVIKGVIATYNGLPIHNRQQLQVSGRDLLEWTDQPGGPWTAQLLNEIEHAVLQGDVSNVREHIKEWVKCKLQ
ncbi:CCA tRNA nucleotidyltransferase [Ectobacillus antri]|uniref:CCA-adding enzyme n=1 Tax=Ectobacillus antri TaxID=2486280 RepID=A0ABT6H1F3_9BACI|nr:CCA tRNA nucleotidyltransferase [Ectobacillus antri]MDG4656122.1 CCA tRNA nucleotidyltransferase [Ectobacillus antri]MDG5752797.1 CCA tRNA nucleotidyltransferase [Ectobacillus antri]